MNSSCWPSMNIALRYSLLPNQLTRSPAVVCAALMRSGDSHGSREYGLGFSSLELRDNPDIVKKVVCHFE